jgi:hypothetical protein
MVLSGAACGAQPRIGKSKDLALCNPPAVWDRHQSGCDSGKPDAGGAAGPVPGAGAGAAGHFGRHSRRYVMGLIMW